MGFSKAPFRSCVGPTQSSFETPAIVMLPLSCRCFMYCWAFCCISCVWLTWKGVAGFVFCKVETVRIRKTRKKKVELRKRKAERWEKIKMWEPFERLGREQREDISKYYLYQVFNSPVSSSLMRRALSYTNVMILWKSFKFEWFVLTACVCVWSQSFTEQGLRGGRASSSSLPGR